MPTPQPVLFFDTASPVVSVAIGAGGEVLAERTIELKRSSERLLPAIEEVLREAALELAGLAGIAAFQGPGSFTGLRVGLGTALGLHQAAGVDATALPTLPVLAAAAAARGPAERGPAERGPAERGPRDVVAAVDAIRGDWYVQRFRATADGGAAPVFDAELLPAAALSECPPCRLIGFGVGRLAGEPAWHGAGIELVEPPPLAPVAARRWSALDLEWDASRLTSPIYFRPPAVTPPEK